MENGNATNLIPPPPVVQKGKGPLFDRPTDLVPMQTASLRAGRYKAFAGQQVKAGRLKVYDTGLKNAKLVSLADVRALGDQARRLRHKRRGRRTRSEIPVEVSVQPKKTKTRTRTKPRPDILIEYDDHRAFDEWCEWVAASGFASLTLTSGGWALDNGAGVVVTRKITE